MHKDGENWVLSSSKTEHVTKLSQMEEEGVGGKNKQGTKDYL